MGTMRGAALSTVFAALLWWWQLRAAQRESGYLPAGRRLWSIRPNRHRSVPATAAPWPDATAPGSAAWLNSAPRAGASSRAPLPGAAGISATARRPEDRTETIPPIPVQPVRVKMPVAAARVLLATGGITFMAVVAATGWTLAHNLTGTHQTADPHAWITEASGQASATGRGTVIGHPPERVHPLKPVSAVSFDPFGDTQGENNKLAHLAIDGNPATAWRTEWYATAAFGNLKPGTGLLLDMGRTVTITSARILLGSMPGADFQLRVGAAASSLTDLPPIAQVSGAGGPVSLQLTRPARGRYVLIWFTRLPPDPSGAFQASVYNVSLEGWGVTSCQSLRVSRPADAISQRSCR